MKTKYIFLDVDGTLYSNDLRGTPQSALDAIHQARENGHKVFLCTGRTKCECADYFQYETDGFIFGAGSSIYAKEEHIFDQPIPTADIRILKQYADELELSYLLEGEKCSYCNQSGYTWAVSYFNDDDKSEQEKQAQMESLHMYLNEWGFEKEDIYKIFFISNNIEVFQKYEAKLQDPYKLTYTHVDFNSFCGAEVTNRSLTKAGGIKQILEYYGANQEDTIAIGDSMNDIDMLEYCHLGIAMGNALPEVKDIADYITSDILEDGIYNAFKYAGVI